ncbi:hypothetical protein SAMN05216522_10383 [Rosenbergiella nectarea]|uniref:Uncharacterized protein n=1 Tax=Rosenbergiella nectarea TaxID=988801 RepID=A0A1H9G5X7_9GAMM|nr:hypothetical protein [Rosenbergiella nectarea]SEQ45492.1 hypothetical protein SAMN05216522_10383 [Rosenbergiella nectarea]
MNKRIKLLSLCASLCIPFMSHADEIVCHNGWTIQLNGTGTKSRFLSYTGSTGTAKLLHYGKVISTKRIEDIEQSVYQTSGAPLVNYEFDVDDKTFYIVALDMSTQGMDAGEPTIALWGGDEMGTSCIVNGSN